MILPLLCSALMIGAVCGCSREETKEVSQQPVTITVWNYYNGEQLDAFNAKVTEFNDTIGMEQGIVVESHSQGSIADLEENLLNAAKEKAGAEELPNIFSAYADTTYALDNMDKIVDLKTYLTEEEWEGYIEGYLQEGDFDGTGSIKIFPISKSTELLCMNETDWEDFAEATGTTYEELQTMEGLVAVAERYYNWTDAKTPEADDGSAFFGRDAMANYFLIGAKQLDCTIFDVEDGKMTVEFDKAVIRKLWDHYYVPFVKGYFAASGRFRSDDIKTGNIIVYQGSSTSVSFFPDQAMTSETESHDITLKVLPAPRFADGKKVAVQQGAGMAVTTGSEEEVQASVTFLKWFTQPENNIEFAINTGYLPVMKEANRIEAIEEQDGLIDEAVKEILEVSLDTVNSQELYTTKAFSQGQDARLTLDYALSDQAMQDRATVEARMQNGMSAKEAQAEFLTEESFENWYQKTLETLKQFEQ